MAESRTMAGSGSGVMPIIGVFVAGAIGVLVFHQIAFWILNQLGIAPPLAWTFAPTQPLQVPLLFSWAFWGGVWAWPTAWLLRGRSGASYWAFAIIFGAVALTLVAWFPVALLKGQPTVLGRPLGIGIIIGPVVNGAWGFGTALVLKLLPAGWTWR